jgi:hypothetical protein
MFITIQNAFVFVDSNRSIWVTIQNEAHVYMNFFLSPPKICTFPPESPCIPTCPHMKKNLSVHGEVFTYTNVALVYPIPQPTPTSGIKRT